MKKKDLLLFRSPNNDEHARAIVGCNRSAEQTKTAIKKWRSCVHLFVKVRDAEYIGAFHSSDCETIPARYECVKCGLTNRMIDVEEHLTRYTYAQFLPGANLAKEITDETIEWRKQRPEITSDNRLSKKVLKTAHPGVLFEIAVDLCAIRKIEMTKENIFGIMKNLCDMETLQEQFKISTVTQASALIERYKEKFGLYED